MHSRLGVLGPGAPAPVPSLPVPTALSPTFGAGGLLHGHTFWVGELTLALAPRLPPASSCAQGLPGSIALQGKSCAPPMLHPSPLGTPKPGLIPGAGQSHQVPGQQPRVCCSRRAWPSAQDSAGSTQRTPPKGITWPRLWVRRGRAGSQRASGIPAGVAAGGQGLGCLLRRSRAGGTSTMAPEHSGAFPLLWAVEEGSHRVFLFSTLGPALFVRWAGSCCAAGAGQPGRLMRLLKQQLHALGAANQGPSPGLPKPCSVMFRSVQRAETACAVPVLSHRVMTDVCIDP